MEDILGIYVRHCRGEGGKGGREERKEGRNVKDPSLHVSANEFGKHATLSVPSKVRQVPEGVPLEEKGGVGLSERAHASI